MIKLIRTTQEVEYQTFDANSQNLFFQKKDKSLIIEDSFFDLIARIDTEYNAFPIGIFGKYFTFKTQKRNFSIYDSHKKLISSFPYGLWNHYRTKMVSNVFSQNYDSSTNKENGLFSYENMKIMWLSTVFNQVFIIDNFTFAIGINYGNKDDFFQIDFQTGDVIWKINVAELGRYIELGTKEQKSGYIHKIIGVHEGIVWVSITNDTILGLSVATGKVLHRIRQTLPFDFEFLNESRIPNSTAVILNKVQKILQGFSQGFYWETDLATMQTQVWNLRAYFQSIPLDDFSFRIEAFGSNHLVFTCGLEYDAIGLFNTQARQVDWWQHLGENGPRRGVNVMTLKVVGDRIYTIDTTNTLRIFECSNK